MWVERGKWVLEFQYKGVRYKRHTDHLDTVTDRKKAFAEEKAWKDQVKADHIMAERNKDPKGKVRDMRFNDLGLAYWNAKYRVKAERAEKPDASHALKTDVRDRKRNLTRLVEWIGPDTMASDIDDPVLEKLVVRRSAEYDERIKDPEKKRLVSPAEVNRSVTELLKAVLLYGRDVLKLHLPDMPYWRQHHLKERKRKRVLTYAEEAKLDDAIREDYAQAIDLAKLTGLRRAQVVALQWSEVDFDEGVIRVRQKGDQPHTVPISPEVGHLLRAQMPDGVRHHATRVFTFVAERTYFNKKAGQGYVKGKRYPLNYQTFGTMWARFREDAGIADLRIHDLRHTYASRLLRESGNLRLVQQALGHSDISMTAVYADAADQIAAVQARVEERTAAIIAEKRSPKSPPMAGAAA